ncbi:MAG: YkgJ family cysteine cluster protein [Dehalococcoidia bacterium]|nr:YkgJ family cysteine cluster protein [Dehalococcoidia bacterium]
MEECFQYNRVLAYKGAVGESRERFCRNYLASKQLSIATLEAKLQEKAAADDTAVTCSRGCIACCQLYIMATLPEVEAIVYYLYQHEAALRHFLTAFASWRERVQQADDIVRRINSLRARLGSGRAGADDMRQYLEAGEAYQRQGIPCPFLMNGDCAIYEARPYACAGVVSISPPEWCDPSHPAHPDMKYVRAEIDMREDIPYFRLPLQKVIYASLPLMVHHILKDGWDALAGIPGLKDIKKDAMNDPAMRAAMKSLGEQRDVA